MKLSSAAYYDHATHWTSSSIPNLLKHKNDVLFWCGLNSTIAELHGDVIGSCKVLSRNAAAVP